MYAALALLALVGCVAANPAVFVRYDDGQWHKELDGSLEGSGQIQYGTEDGSWKPDQDQSWLGRGDLVWTNRRKRNADPNSLSQPADEPTVAYAKNAQLRQQYTEGQRNILGGGIPQDLPADTPEVAAGKRAHAVAHENEKLATSGARYATPIHHVTTISTNVAPVAARVYTPVAYAPVPHIAAPVAHVVSPVAHVAAPVTHITTVTRTFSPVAHIAAPVAHIASPVLHPVSPYQYAYSPVVQVFKK